jgi:hypothetical protein
MGVTVPISEAVTVQNRIVAFGVVQIAGGNDVGVACENVNGTRIFGRMVAVAGLGWQKDQSVGKGRYAEGKSAVNCRHEQRNF